MKMPKEIFFSPSKGVVEKMETEKYLKVLKKDLGVDKGDDFGGLLKVATDDRYDLAVDEDTPAKERKRLEKIVTGIRDCLEKSEEFKKEMEAEALREKEKAEAEKAKRGELIHIAAQDGLSISGEWMAPALNTVQKGLGKKFVVNDVGLERADGAKITEAEFTKAISQLSNGTIKTAEFNTRISWMLGDVCLMAREAGDGSDEDMERIVVQAVKETGKAKHTVIQAMRTCAKVDHAMRRKNPRFSFTHWQEFLNYEGGFKSKKEANEFLDEVSSLEEVPSCASLREALQEATGKKPDKPTPSTASRYLYITGTEVYVSPEISLLACADEVMTVIDLKAGVFLNTEGEASTKLKALPKKWFKELPEEKEEAKAEASDDDDLP